MIRPVLAFFLVSALATPAFAQAVEDLDQLDSRVQRLTGAAAGQQGGAVAPIDRRLRLVACPQPASIEWSGSDSLAIRCPAIGWRLRVGIASSSSGPQARAELWVHRGDTVEISVEGEDFDVTTTAISLDDGAKGQSVRLKLGSSGTQSSATVTGPGSVSFSR
jgi:flagella basal body P-ring formation protein FlgA